MISLKVCSAVAGKLETIYTPFVISDCYYSGTFTLPISLTVVDGMLMREFEEMSEKKDD